MLSEKPMSRHLNFNTGCRSRMAVFLFGAFIAAIPAAAQSPLGSGDKFITPPAIERELRGVWVATVSNIDWPSRPGLSTAEQKRELLAILDRAAELHLNAVVLQVRPAADALYASSLEPWSEYLTGEMGKAPSPFWDPLEFAVTEAHARGLELHAWFNPYRARHPSARSPISPSHISVTHPELVRKYGTHLWMDPGEPAVREHSLRVILDVVRRYDIDGVHIDDYFYPYSENDSAGKKIEFPDSASYARYLASGGTLARDDWRRDNVDRLVHELYTGIKAIKPAVKFGVSPFGIWRPGFPEQIKGFDAYSQLFADSRKWLTNGWVDYWTPQLYWIIGKPDERYPLLLDWWASQNVAHRNLWIGNYSGRVTGKPNGWPASEILNQIAMTRAQTDASGNIFFSMKSLMQNDSLSLALVGGPYKFKTLVPASRWLDSIPPAQPKIRIRRENSGNPVTVAIIPRGREAAALWLVRVHAPAGWTYDIIPGRETSYALPAELGAADMVAVSAVDRSGNESFRAILKIDPPHSHGNPLEAEK
jgi:uncharacterized lipoprotein YddW (UPF0748 family)